MYEILTYGTQTRLPDVNLLANTINANWWNGYAPGTLMLQSFRWDRVWMFAEEQYYEVQGRITKQWLKIGLEYRGTKWVMGRQSLYDSATWPEEGLGRILPIQERLDMGERISSRWLGDDGRLRRVNFPPDIVLACLNAANYQENTSTLVLPKAELLPPGSTVLEVNYDPIRRSFVAIVHCPTFSRIEQGGEIPYWEQMGEQWMVRVGGAEHSHMKPKEQRWRMKAHVHLGMPNRTPVSPTLNSLITDLLINKDDSALRDYLYENEMVPMCFFDSFRGYLWYNELGDTETERCLNMVLAELTA